MKQSLSQERSGGTFSEFRVSRVKIKFSQVCKPLYVALSLSDMACSHMYNGMKRVFAVLPLQ